MMFSPNVGFECSIWLSSDRFVDLSPNPVDALVKVWFQNSYDIIWFRTIKKQSLLNVLKLLCQLDEDRLIAGSENGLIR